MSKPWIIRWTCSEVAAKYRLHDVNSAADIAEFAAVDVVEDRASDAKSVAIRVPTTIYGLRLIILNAIDAAGVETASAAYEVDFGARPPEKPINVTGEAGKA